MHTDVNKIQVGNEPPNDGGMISETTTLVSLRLQAVPKSYMQIDP